MCSSAIRYNSISLYLNKTLPNLAPLVGYFRIYDIVWHFHFFLLCNLSQLRCFVVIMETTHGPNIDRICSSLNLNSCRANDVQRKSVCWSMPTLPIHNDMVLFKTISLLSCPIFFFYWPNDCIINKKLLLLIFKSSHQFLNLCRLPDTHLSCNARTFFCIASSYECFSPK